MQTPVRKAAEADLAAILPLWRELMETHASLDPRFRVVSDAITLGETHRRAELTAPASLLAVAEHDSAIVAYCRASVRQESPIFEQRAHGFISELHVKSPLQRRGIGTGLFQYVQRWFREQGIARIELVTLNANQNSNAFWQKVGCKPFAERRCVELTGV